MGEGQWPGSGWCREELQCGGGCGGCAAVDPPGSSCSRRRSISRGRSSSRPSATSSCCSCRGQGRLLGPPPPPAPPPHRERTRGGRSTPVPPHHTPPARPHLGWSIHPRPLHAPPPPPPPHPARPHAPGVVDPHAVHAVFDGVEEAHVLAIHVDHHVRVPGIPVLVVAGGDRDHVVPALGQLHRERAHDWGVGGWEEGCVKVSWGPQDLGRGVRVPGAGDSRSSSGRSSSSRAGRRGGRRLVVGSWLAVGGGWHGQG